MTKYWWFKAPRMPWCHLAEVCLCCLFICFHELHNKLTQISVCFCFLLAKMSQDISQEGLNKGLLHSYHYFKGIHMTQTTQRRELKQSASEKKFHSLTRMRKQNKNFTYSLEHVTIWVKKKKKRIISATIYLFHSVFLSHSFHCFSTLPGEYRVLSLV